MKTTSTKKDKQKSIAIALLLYSFLLIILFFIRFWPPSNIAELVGGGGGGVEINFGDTDMGMGDDFSNKTLDIKDDTKPAPAVETPDESIVTDDNSTDEAAIISKKESVKKTKIVIKKDEKPIVAVTKPKVITNSALSNIIKGAKNGDGNSKIKGNQGKNNGNLTSNGYDLDGNGDGKGDGDGKGNGDGKGKGNGKGLGSGYTLGNRKALSTPKPDSSCSNETGKVVVEVTVDKNGNTIAAEVGKRGTDVTSTCLRQQAKQAAMATKWAPSPNGTEQQKGEIIYSFGLN
jgi:hypothetical protein